MTKYLNKSFSVPTGMPKVMYHPKLGRVKILQQYANGKCLVMEIQGNNQPIFNAKEKIVRQNELYKK